MPVYRFNYGRWVQSAYGNKAHLRPISRVGFRAWIAQHTWEVLAQTAPSFQLRAIDHITWEEKDAIPS